MLRLTGYRSANSCRSRLRNQRVTCLIRRGLFRGLFLCASVLLIHIGYLADAYADPQTGKVLARQVKPTLNGASRSIQPQPRSIANGMFGAGGAGASVGTTGKPDVKSSSASTNDRGALADQGQVNVESGGSATVDFVGDGLIRFRIDGKVTRKTQGAVGTFADGETTHSRVNTVEFSENAAAEVFTAAVNSESIRRADGIGKKGDKVLLMDSGGINDSTTPVARKSVGNGLIAELGNNNRSANNSGKGSGPAEFAPGLGAPAVADSFIGPADHAGGSRSEESKARVFLERQGEQLSLRIGSDNGNGAPILSVGGAGDVFGDVASKDTSLKKECASETTNADVGACVSHAVVARLGLVDFGLFLLPEAYAKSDTAIRPVALRDPDFPVDLRPMDPEDEQAWRGFYDDVHAFLRERHFLDGNAPEEISRAAQGSLVRDLGRTIAYYERVRARESALRRLEARLRQLAFSGSAPDIDAQKSVVEVENIWWPQLGVPWPAQSD